MARPSLYRRITESIRAEIAPFANDQEIPSIRTLARQHQASDNTVRKAIEILIAQGEVVSAGQGRRLIRRRRAGDERFNKPYPAVGLVSTVSLDMESSSYMGLLLRSFVGRVVWDLTLSIPRHGRESQLKPIPGGLEVRPGGGRYSAVAFRSGMSDSVLQELVVGGAIVMVLDDVSDVPGVDCVAVDCAREGETAVEHLHGLGHRRIA